MFTQKISMDCTQEQYEKYLKAELEKMGYEQEFWSHLPIIVNNLSRENGSCGSVYLERNTYGGRTYLGKFNANLFLALAAMTDKVEGGYREYYVKDDEFYSMKENGFLGANGFFRKATVSEIMAKFGKQPKKDIYITLAFEKEPIWENCEKHIEEFEAIHLLKTQGYRIFKQTTTLEEV